MTQPQGRKKYFTFQSRWESIRSVHESQRLYIRNEISKVHGLIPILMKRRNGERWSMEERIILRRNLQALSNLSPYLIPLVMPGGILMLPALAWWLDTRRHKRKPERCV